MAVLSKFEATGMAFKLADIFLTNDEQDLRDGGVLTFEISEHQGESLKTLIGKPEQFLLDSSHGFWGELLKLERLRQYNFLALPSRKAGDAGRFEGSQDHQGRRSCRAELAARA